MTSVMSSAKRLEALPQLALQEEVAEKDDPAVDQAVVLVAMEGARALQPCMCMPLHIMTCVEWNAIPASGSAPSASSWRFQPHA